MYLPLPVLFLFLRTWYRMFWDKLSNPVTPPTVEKQTLGMFFLSKIQCNPLNVMISWVWCKLKVYWWLLFKSRDPVVKLVLLKVKLLANFVIFQQSSSLSKVEMGLIVTRIKGRVFPLNRNLVVLSQTWDRHCSCFFSSKINCLTSLENGSDMKN